MKPPQLVSEQDLIRIANNIGTNQNIILRYLDSETSNNDELLDAK